MRCVTALKTTKYYNMAGKITLSLTANPAQVFEVNERTFNAVYKKRTAKPDGDAEPEKAKYQVKKNTPPVIKTITKNKE